MIDGELLKVQITSVVKVSQRSFVTNNFAKMENYEISIIIKITKKPHEECSH